jgi:hypothetical protein
MNFRNILSFVLLILVSSCSLLKVTLESDVKPLPKNDLNTRIAVRAFQNNLSSAIIKVSDSMSDLNDSIAIKLNIIQFKQGVIKASAKTAYQAVPELSLVDTWILCKQIVAVTQTDFGQSFLGPNHKLMEDAAVELEAEITDIAKSLLNKNRFNELESFVIQYAVQNPVKSFDFPRANILSPLSDHLGVADTSYVKTLGSGAEAMSDIGDRIGITKDLIDQQLSWEKERFELQWEDKNPSEAFLARADSLTFMLDRLAIIAEESPELLGEVSVNMRKELMPLINELSGGLNASVNKLADERMKMQLYLDEQRKLMVTDLNITGENMIKQSATRLSEVIKDVAWIIILALIVIVLVLLGVPFATGFYLAKAKFKKDDT